MSSVLTEIWARQEINSVRGSEQTYQPRCLAPPWRRLGRLGAGGHHDSLARTHAAPSSHFPQSPTRWCRGWDSGNKKCWDLHLSTSSCCIPADPIPRQRTGEKEIIAEITLPSPSQALLPSADGGRNAELPLGETGHLSSPGLSRNSWLHSFLVEAGPILGTQTHGWALFPE